MSQWVRGAMRSWPSDWVSVAVPAPVVIVLHKKVVSCLHVCSILIPVLADCSDHQEPLYCAPLVMLPDGAVVSWCLSGSGVAVHLLRLVLGPVCGMLCHGDRGPDAENCGPHARYHSVSDGRSGGAVSGLGPLGPLPALTISVLLVPSMVRYPSAAPGVAAPLLPAVLRRLGSAGGPL